LPSLPSLPIISSAPPPPPVASPPPLPGLSSTSSLPSVSSPTPPELPPVPANPPAPRKRRNPFDAPPPSEPAHDEAAHPSNGTAPPPRKRRNPFDGPPISVAPEPDSRAHDRRPPPPRSTLLVMPLARTRRVPLWLVLASAVLLGAILTGLYMSHRVQSERIESERQAKQRLAEELQAQAEAMRKLTAPPDAGIKPQVKPLVTPAETPVAVLPRSGPCPLGAHLVGGAGRPFCVDVYEYPGGNTMPRTSVSFAEAGHICSQRGERLCSEAEWERACRGKGAASYPYGQTFDPTRCNTKGNSGEIAPTGTFASCKSASGAYDMSGNVGEWVASGAQKGGSAQHGAREARCSALVKGAAVEGSVFVGFRCCADPGPFRR
jgi:hypothetical protein